MFELPLSIKDILGVIPHRYPFLLVDRVLSITGPGPLDDDNPKTKIGIKVVGLKNLTFNEPFFQGHFPDAPVMPGVLIIEAMAQVASFSMYPTIVKKVKEQGESYQTILVGVDNVRFRSPVTPGDVLRLEVEVTHCRSYLMSFACKAYVTEKLVAEADIMANIYPVSKKKVI